MKLNLILTNDFFRNGYINVCPFADAESEEVRITDVFNLEEICCDYEAEEIVSTNVLEYQHYGVVHQTIAHWITKLKKGGKLTIITTNVNEVLRHYQLGLLNMQQLNMVFFENGNKKSCLCLDDILEVMKHMNMKIIKKTMVGLNSVVVGEKQ